MSSLRDQIRARSAELVKREKVTMPKSGVEVQVRGLMVGEVRRAGDHKRPADVQIALSVEDPETGKQVWNPNDLNDLDEIAALHAVDAATLLRMSDRLSGMAELGKMQSPPTENGSSSSLSSSAEPSGN